MDAAKKIMRQSGNMHQWGEGYPSETVIMADLERNGGFTYCGIIYLANGDERLAYQKLKG